jgi:hypothetical protein
MHAKISITLRCVALLAGASLGLPRATAAAKPTDAFPNSESYIKISGRAADISGSKSAFERRLQQSGDGGAGIEELHYTKDITKDKILTIDGRALTGSENYLLKLNLTKAEFGSVEMGYKRFRTFYDGIGGFFPLNGTWMPLNPRDLHVDRGNFWVEAKWEAPDRPAFELSYSNRTRTGQKDTTVWGDTDFTGLPNNVPPISPVRKLVASYRDLNERHQELESSVKHTLGKTTYKLTLLGDTTNDLDTRYGTRFPGEAKRFPAPAATVLVPAANMNNQVAFSQRDGMKTNLFGVTATTSTEFSPKATLETGFNYQLLHSDFTGDRPLSTTTPTAVGNVIAPSNNYLGLAGGSKVKIYTGTVGLTLKPAKHFSAKLALKGEDEYVSGSGTFTSVAAAVNTTTGAVTITNTPQAESSRLKEKSLTPALDLNYTGFPDLALYASGSQRIVNGDERYAAPYNPVTTPVPPVGNLANNDMSRDKAKYAIGATWRQSLLLTLRGEVFYKDNTTKSVGYGVDLGDYYALASQFTGVKLTATAKPNAQFGFTTRYVYQKGKAQVTGFLPAFPEYDSMDMTCHSISETIDWTPNPQFYVQANASFVFNVISTIYPRAGVVPAAGTSISWNANAVLRNADNNYVTGSLVAGAVLTKHDDLLVQVIYYRADNYDPINATRTLPYGAGAREYSVTAGVKHKFSDRLLGNAKLGYFDSRNDTTGGNTNFHGPLAYVSLEIGL